VPLAEKAQLRSVAHCRTHDGQSIMSRLVGRHSKCNISASTGAKLIKLVSMETPMCAANRRIVGSKNKCWCGDAVDGRRQWVWQDWKMLLLFSKCNISASTGANSTKLVPMDSPMHAVHRQVDIVARKCWCGVGIVGRRQEEWGMLDNAAALFKMQHLSFHWSKFHQTGVNGDSNASRKRAGNSLLV